MGTYSHSRLSTFEQCPFKFKLKYIDKIIPEIDTTIEALLGNCVHSALEWLYNNLNSKAGKIPSTDEVLTAYIAAWEQEFFPEIKIVRNNTTPKDYFNKGIKFLVDYCNRHSPFEDNTLETEKQILINLDEKGEHKIQGFIDRLAYNPETGEYEIHDYKTSNSLPTKEKIEADRQLALYSIAIKEIFGNDKKVCLIWHYLAHDAKICSSRTNEQLAQLKKETIKLIKKIENTTEFPACTSALCNWCEYNYMCEEFKKRH